MAKSKKSPSALRTISEVAEDLNLPQHVLRFWELKFSKLNPLKRGGGRRYYRPEDLALLKKIQTLLYEDGYTVKGVQNLLRKKETDTKLASSSESLDEIIGKNKKLELQSIVAEFQEIQSLLVNKN